MPRSKGRKVHLIQGYEIWTGGDVRERLHAALRLPNRKIAISSQLKFDIEAELGDLDIRVVPNAVDLVQFDAPWRDRGSPPTVGFTYSRLLIKGADLIYEACRIVRQEIPELRTLAFGSEHPSEDLPLPPDTEFHYRPAQDQIAGLYARCDAWLFASRLDSFGLPMLEAMACRTPVIGVPIGAAPDLLADGAGILVPSESPEAIAAALLTLLRSPAETWRRMSTISYERAHAYSWNDATALLLEAIGDQP
jgi:glycosyltransferase involved in cell wall biosynthesis